MNGLFKRTIPPLLALGALLLSGCMEEFHVPEADTEDGKVFVRRCSLCHALPNPSRMEYPKWQVVVERMARNIKAHNVPPMPLDEKIQILAYLKRNAKPITPRQTVPETTPPEALAPEPEPAKMDSTDTSRIEMPAPGVRLVSSAPTGASAHTVMDQKAFEAAGLTPLERPQPAPAFELTDLSGKPVSLSDHRGKLVLLNFWATWCGPCVKEMPTLQRVAKTLGPQGLSVLAISLDKLPRQDVALFAHGYRWKLPILLDPAGETGDRYGVRLMPSTYLIGPDGMILAHAFGIREWDAPSTVELLTQLLKTA